MEYRDYNPDIEKRYITYFDANALYAASMVMPLPIGAFEWVEENKFSEIDYMRLPPDANIAYIYVCDLEHPPELHPLTLYFPLVVKEDWLSAYQKQLLTDLQYKPPKVEKLLLTCTDKKEYVVHYSLLALYCRIGLKAELGILTRDNSRSHNVIGRAVS